MRDIGLSARELELMGGVFRGYTDIQQVLLYGSRAKGTHSPQSDIDLALIGVKNALEVEAVALALDELPLPYRFDVRAFEGIRMPVCEHISNVWASLCIAGTRLRLRHHEEVMSSQGLEVSQTLSACGHCSGSPFGRARDPARDGPAATRSRCRRCCRSTRSMP